MHSSFQHHDLLHDLYAVIASTVRGRARQREISRRPRSISDYWPPVRHSICLADIQPSTAQPKIPEIVRRTQLHSVLEIRDRLLRLAMKPIQLSSAEKQFKVSGICLYGLSKRSNPVMKVPVSITADLRQHHANHRRSARLRAEVPAGGGRLHALSVICT